MSCFWRLGCVNKRLMDASAQRFLAGEGIILVAIVLPVSHSLLCYFHGSLTSP